MANSAREAKAIVKKAIEAGGFVRGYYKYAAHFIMLLLGVRITDGTVYKFPDLAKNSNARFIQRFVMKYYLKYFIFAKLTSLGCFTLC